MITFTPGPWLLRTWETGAPNLIEGQSSGEWVCTFPSLMPEARERQKVNAHLIVAAPDLYEALRELYDGTLKGLLPSLSLALKCQNALAAAEVAP